MKHFLKRLWAIISPPPIKFKTYYRGWKIEIKGRDAVLSKGDERFYASPRLGIVALIRFCRRKVDRLEVTGIFAKETKHERNQGDIPNQ